MKKLLTLVPVLVLVFISKSQQAAPTYTTIFDTLNVFKIIKPE